MALPRLLDRELEQSRLADTWKATLAGRPQLAVVWGRRRVGKTFLLSHFAADKRAVFFSATQQAEHVELSRLLESVGRDLGPDVSDLTGGSLVSWEAALRFLAAQARHQPLLVVLDEVPYLARSSVGFASVVQAFWDHVGAGTRLMLVLTGSAIGSIESMLGGGGALRGRPTLTLRMEPMDATAAQAFLPSLEPTRFLEAYAACGGYPLHLKAWDARSSTEANLARLAGTVGGILLEDAAGILREELPDTGGYQRILAAVGRGRTRQSEIQNEAAQRVEHPLDVLVRCGFVRRAVPVGAPNKARPLYEINDVYLSFWFTVLYADLAQVEADQGSAVLRRRRESWQRHLGSVFEDLARRHAIRLVQSGRLPEDLVVGRWWASSGDPCEVDVLGLRSSRTHLLGEAKWQTRAVGSRELHALTAKGARVPSIVKDPVYALWARESVEPAVTKAGALGFTLADMLA